MPKETRERTIDSGLLVRGGGGSASGGGAYVLPQHNSLPGLTDGDPHTQYLNTARGDARYYTETEVDAWRTAHLVPDAHHNRVTVAAPLTVDAAQALALTLGTGLEVSSNALRVKRPTNSGLALDANGLAVGTPDGLSVSSTNNVTTTTHGHAITSSADPDAAASLLATAVGGLLTLRNLAARQAVQSHTTFAAGFAGSGWRVDYGLSTSGKATAEFDSLTVRGSARFYELLIQQIRATNGSLFVSSASKVVDATGETNPLWTVNGVQLTFNGSPANLTTQIYQVATAAAGDSGRELYHGFLTGDLIRSQEVRWNGSSYGAVRISSMEVTAVADLYHYQATLVSGSAPAAGTDYVRLGNAVNTARRGSIYLTSDDSNAPFIDIVDGVKSFADWNSAGLARTRVGKLTGISDTDFGGALSGYGLYSQNVYLKGQIFVTGGNAATTGYVDQGLSVKASTAYVDAIAALKANLTYVDSTLAAAVAPLAAITYVDDQVTHIDGGNITTGTINANRIGAVNLAVLQAAVANLAALNANLGAVTAGQIVVGAGNKLWLNDSADGSLAIGGTVKASAPFRVSAAGSLVSTDATFGDLLVAGSGAYIAAQATDNIFANGYKFTQGGAISAGMTASYVASTLAQLALYNNYDTDGTAKYAINSTIALKNYSGGAGKTAGITLAAIHESGGSASIEVTSSDTTQAIAMQGDVLTWNGSGIWHAGNLTPSNYAPLVSPPFTGTPTSNVFSINVNGDTGAGANYIDLGRWRNVTSNTALSTPATNQARIHFWINSSGKGRLSVVWPSGVKQDFATEPA